MSTERRSSFSAGKTPVSKAEKARKKKERADAEAQMEKDAAIFGIDSEQKARSSTTWMLDPYNQWRKRWDVFVLLLLLYCSSSIPYRLGFNIWPEPASPEGIWESFVDACFWLDIVLNFCTSVYIDGRLVSEPIVSAKLYLRFWFWVDFCSVFPFEDIVAVFIVHKGNKALRLTRMIRIIRIFRVLRMVRMLSRWQKHIYINKSVQRCVMFLLCLVYLAHILACFWFWTASLNDFDEETWVSRYYSDERSISSHPSQWADLPNHVAATWNWYFISIYWAIMTVTTVGYGDITPYSDSERIFTCMAMLIGGGMYAYVVGGFAALVQDYDPIQKNYDSKMLAVQTYMQMKEFPNSLQYRVREYYDHTFRAKLLAIDEKTIMNDMSEELRQDMYEFVNTKALTRISIFTNLHKNFFRLLPSLIENFTTVEYVFIVEQQVAASENQEGNALYFIESGEIEVSKAGKGVITRLPEGSVFGEGVVLNGKYMATYTAALNTTLLTVPVTVLNVICKYFPSVQEDLLEIAKLRTEQLENAPYLEKHEEEPTTLPTAVIPTFDAPTMSASDGRSPWFPPGTPTAGEYPSTPGEYTSAEGIEQPAITLESLAELFLDTREQLRAQQRNMDILANYVEWSMRGDLPPGERYAYADQGSA